MPTKTKIEWTDYSTNPLKYRDRLTGDVVWACVHKSDGCSHCYAETLANRWHRGRPFTAPHIAKVEPFTDRKELEALTYSTAISGKRVFVEDMSDLFGEWVDFDHPRAIFGVFARRQDVTWQVLTKRPKRMGEFVATTTPTQIYIESQDIIRDGINHFDGRWPLPNVWIGTSVEDDSVRHRIDDLAEIPAAVRFLSCEPLIGGLSITSKILGRCPEHDGPGMGCGMADSGWCASRERLIHWVIAGGESGPGKRPMDLQWARDLRDQCRSANVPFFFKQIDGRKPIPDDLMVREFPQTTETAPA